MKRLVSATETVAAVFLLAIALLTATNVALRGAFTVQVPDWFDGTKLLMAIALFWGIAVATYHGSHIAVDIVWEHVGPRAKRWIDLVAASVTLLFLAPAAWMVFSKALAGGSQTTSDLRLPLVWFTATAAAGMAAAAALALARLMHVWRGQRDDGQAPTEPADGP